MALVVRIVVINKSFCWKEKDINLCDSHLIIFTLTKGENVNHAYIEDVEKKSLDYHHQKGGECESIYTGFDDVKVFSWWAQID